VKTLISFNRTAVWITPELVADLAPEGRETKFSPEQQEAWAKDPDALLRYRKRAEGTMNHFFDLQIKTSSLQKEAFAATKKSMQQLLTKGDLASRLIPNFALGCRRYVTYYLKSSLHSDLEFLESHLVMAT
jgi:hypothetical protein